MKKINGIEHFFKNTFSSHSIRCFFVYSINTYIYFNQYFFTINETLFLFISVAFVITVIFSIIVFFLNNILFQQKSSLIKGSPPEIIILTGSLEIKKSKILITSFFWKFIIRTYISIIAAMHANVEITSICHFKYNHFLISAFLFSTIYHFYLQHLFYYAGNVSFILLIRQYCH
mgnify:CR=1 FL=1